MTIPRVLIWNDQRLWEDDPGASLPSNWLRGGHDVSADPTVDLVIASLAGAPEQLAHLRGDCPEVGLLLVVDRNDPLVERFLGDQGVFFVAQPLPFEQLRTCVREVLSFREESQHLRAVGGDLPPIEEAEPVTGWYELTGPTHPVFLRRFRTWIASLGRLPLDERELRRLVHAVREVGWNAIEWGNRFDLRRRLELACMILDDRLVFRIQDEGGAGDWHRDVPGDAPAETQEKRRSAGRRYGGLGLTLVKKIMDRIEISSNGNIVVMEKYLQPGAQEGTQDSPWTMEAS